MEQFLFQLYEVLIWLKVFYLNSYMYNKLYIINISKTLNTCLADTEIIF